MSRNKLKHSIFDDFVTNAVKHFKFEPRGKRRLHKKPDAGEIDACRWWLEQERRLVAPGLIVAMGATALRGVLGRAEPVSRLRGRLIELDRGAMFLATIHPSFLLRLREEADKREQWARFLGDLEIAAHWARAGDGFAEMRKAMVLAVCLLGAPARAEVAAVEENGPELRLTLTLEGKPHRVAGKLLRTKTAPGAAPSLLIDIAPRDDLSGTAQTRNMVVFSSDLAGLPPSLRAAAIRDLAPMLRKKTGAGRLFGHGAGAVGAALAETGALFDGLLLEDIPPGAPAPRSIEIWGSDAWWRGTPRPAPAGPEPANRRSFFVTGTTGCGAERAPALRALLVVLDDWAKGVKPPASRAPSAADLVAADALIWPKIPGLPPAPGGARLVPKIDADGNEAGGLRLPDHALPLATFTGFGAPDCGVTLPFPATKAEREKTGDPRAALVERYGSRAYFVATMRVVADKLVKERLLLKEDADAYVAAARTAPF